MGSNKYTDIAAVMAHMDNVEAEKELPAFIKESNAIEGIHREPTPEEIAECKRFMRLPSVEIADLVNFVRVYQPDATLRIRRDQNVQVGHHIAPQGGPDIVRGLQAILASANMNKGDRRVAYDVHVEYEKLHPFMDGNGRSGRMLWKWMVGRSRLSFLHAWYYSSLDAAR